MTTEQLTLAERVKTLEDDLNTELRARREGYVATCDALSGELARAIYAFTRTLNLPRAALHDGATSNPYFRTIPMNAAAKRHEFYRNGGKEPTKTRKAKACPHCGGAL
jgi:hypothetical protein